MADARLQAQQRYRPTAAAVQLAPSVAGAVGSGCGGGLVAVFPVSDPRQPTCRRPIGLIERTHFVHATLHVARSSCMQRCMLPPCQLALPASLGHSPRVIRANAAAGFGPCAGCGPAGCCCADTGGVCVRRSCGAAGGSATTARRRRSVRGARTRVRRSRSGGALRSTCTQQCSRRRYAPHTIISTPY